MSGIDIVMEILRENGFSERPRPLEVGQTKFDFEAAAVGTGRSHDLIIVAGSAIEPGRLQRMVDSVARGLDLGESKRPLTVVLIGSESASARDGLEEVARVLLVGSNPTKEEVRDALAVLLPLRAVPGEDDRGVDPLDEVRVHLANWNQDFDQFLIAARQGQESVEKVLSRYVNDGVTRIPEGGEKVE